MAIGTTIVTRGTEQDFDIDIVAELDLPLDSDPAKVLDALYLAIAGERGSRYFNMVKRRTRCITVYYEDGMHLDVTPVIRRFDRAERTSDLFHDDPDKPSELPVTLLMNAWGFAQVFKERTADTTSFAENYSVFRGELLSKQLGMGHTEQGGNGRGRPSGRPGTKVLGCCRTPANQALPKRSVGQPPGAHAPFRSLVEVRLRRGVPSGVIDASAWASRGIYQESPCHRGERRKPCIRGQSYVP